MTVEIILKTDYLAETVDDSGSSSCRNKQTRKIVDYIHRQQSIGIYFFLPGVF